MITIKSPDFSFVQFSKTVSNCKSHLQVSLEDDLAFQFTATGSAVEIQGLLSTGVDLTLVNHETLEPTGSYTSFEGVPINDKAALFCWNGLFDVGGWKRGKCFRLMFEVDGEKYYSNCFRYDTDIEETSVIRYVCYENAYGFNYCEGCENKVRIPIRLMRPQLVDDETVYVRSDGKRVVLKSITSKSYEGETEHLPFELHEKIKVALSHDDVHITSKNYSGGIRKDGAYEINWPSFPAYSEAKATFKVFATPYLVRNDNCKVCDHYEPAEPCVPLSSAPLSLPDASGGQSYLAALPVTGSDPVLSQVSAPAWLNVTLAGNTITIYGTTPETGGAGLVSFKLSNDCSEINLSANITVTHECIPVNFSTTLPDGQVGEPYSHEITLSGSQPFALSNEVKPAWAAISLAGNKITIGGTPDTEGSASIGFTVTNCADDSQNFNQNISISPAGASNRHLDVLNYDFTGGAISGACTVSVTFTRSQEARDDASATGDRVEVRYRIKVDSGALDTFDIVFEPGDLSVAESLDMSGGGTQPCSAIDEIKALTVQVI